ncbi:unnamed protein product [Brachionus calyciflorus]|uniref:Vitamin K-dependent gamma-carboxylase n=1 Tax=Brachionus calyciflorus TaxID=104777 RepID=A0A813SIK7_9BILA|nr:unnamed protein product [Brachionus calyciflorus]
MPSKPNSKSQFELLFGFDYNDIKSWPKLVNLMNRPEDPSALALFRILFGFIMMLDIPYERGMSEADVEFGDPKQCDFPLFDFLRPLAPEWMVIIYGIMFFGALGIMLGFKYRWSCFCFLIPYWYFFFLDKTTWNNHSYLYGLFGFMLLFMDANRYWSIDGLIDKSIRDAHVPLWNYALLRFQVFLVYFIAGLKKTELDWVKGYSMGNLGSHWVFDPFKTFLTTDQITLFIVHGGGLFIDLFVGYMLFFDKTRLLGTLISSSFHIMNSRMFNIGMFPYTMLATTTLFYSADWPKVLMNKFGLVKPIYDENGKFLINKLSEHCIYEKSKSENKKESPKRQSLYHKIFTILSLLYIAEQCFLPYSHFITKGYNNWTNGLYGYSWDMMIHSWHTQHIKIHFVDKKTNQTHFINPKAWTMRRRWSSHGDMMYQYSKCIQKRLSEYGFNDIELYFDIWRSMNHRFNQRQIDPRVDMTKVEWSPFKKVDWLIPLMTDLSDWRGKMKEIEDQYIKNKTDYDLTFVADLKGLKLENYVSPFLNSSVEVLNGEIQVEIELKEKRGKKQNITLQVGDKLTLPSGTYHSVYTTSEQPSCFFYIYVNETALVLSDWFDNFSKNMFSQYNNTIIDLKKDLNEASLNGSYETELIWKAYNQTLIENSKNFYEMIARNNSNQEQNLEQDVKNVLNYLNEKKLNRTMIYTNFVNEFYTKFNDKIVKSKYSFAYKNYRKLLSVFIRFKQSFSMLYYAIRSVLFKENFSKVVNTELFNF